LALVVTPEQTQSMEVTAQTLFLGQLPQLVAAAAMVIKTTEAVVALVVAVLMQVLAVRVQQVKGLLEETERHGLVVEGAALAL
jgi:hypothetical protein